MAIHGGAYEEGFPAVECREQVLVLTAAQLFAAADARPFAGSAAEPPRASWVQVSVWPAREGRARLSERTFGGPVARASEGKERSRSTAWRNHGFTFPTCSRRETLSFPFSKKSGMLLRRSRAR